LIEKTQRSGGREMILATRSHSIALQSKTLISAAPVEQHALPTTEAGGVETHICGRPKANGIGNQSALECVAECPTAVENFLQDCKTPRQQRRFLCPRFR
jgi:hypothetical protein